jgi:5-methyltetrahydrofolate--homocysteine methyltransferase
MNPSEFNAFLKENILFVDGAMGTMAQELNLEASYYGGEELQMLQDILVLSHPDAVMDIHLQYFRAGANAVETDTLCSSALRLSEFDFAKMELAKFPEQFNGKTLNQLSFPEISYLLSQRAAQIARKAIEQYQNESEYNDRPLFVIGSLGPSNFVLSSTHADLTKGEFNQVEQNFYDQTRGLIDGGADILLFETQQDILELKAGVLGAKRAMKEKDVDLPIMAQVTVDPFAKMQIFNTDIVAAMTTLQDIGIHAFGINCGLGPDQMTVAVERLSRYSRLPISIIPNAGLPESEGGKTVYKLTPESLAEQMNVFVKEFGVNIVGGCCGTTPEHIRCLVETIGDQKPRKREVEPGVFISGPQKAVSLDSSAALIRIGERLNVRGSKKVREAVEVAKSIDHDALEEVVSEQVRDLGLEIIDVCMDSNLVETGATLVEVIKSQTLDFPAAMSIDSFDVEALGKAMEVYPGRAIVNSISLEEVEPGLDKIDAVLEKTLHHAPVYIVLLTGPEGPAVTVEKKEELARLVFEKVTKKYDIKPEQLLFDINAFPIGSEPEPGLNFSVESIQSIPKIKALHPDVKTIIGVGNLTAGLAKKPYMRRVLTSVFLDEARKMGLDAAIVNPNHYVPVDSLPDTDYALGRKVVLEHDMDAFSELEEIALAKKGVIKKKAVSYDQLAPIEAVCAKIKDGYKERGQDSVTIGEHTFEYHDRIVLQVSELIREMDPLGMINQHLMPAMEELGDGFAAGNVSLPHLLKSADVMKHVMGFLESYMKRISGMDIEEEIKSKGTIVLGTVYQDVHSIGKDLSKTLMENYGFKVIDLGVQVPLQKFIDEAKAHEAMAIGMSALLVQTSNHMITVSEMTQSQGMGDIPLLIGGAPVNQRHAAQAAMAKQDDISLIRDNVLYCKSGMDGVNFMNQLLDPTNRENLLEGNKEKLVEAYHSGQKMEADRLELLSTLPKRSVEFKHAYSDIKQLSEVKKLEFSMSEFLPYLNEKLLFTLNWKYGGQGGWKKKGIELQDLQEKLQEWVRVVEEKNWIRPQALYSLFPCRSQSDRVLILDPVTKKEIATFTFNDVIGQGKKDIFNVARFYNPDQEDVIGIQISTAGPDVGRAVLGLKDRDQESALFLQGLSNRVAEDMASQANAKLNDWIFGDSGGSSCRYSPGYPAMSDIQNNQTIVDLLDALNQLRIEITEGYEFSPTSTTAAIVCFHPDAGYK